MADKDNAPIVKPVIKKLVKKKWLRIIAPAMFKRQPIGEAFAVSAEDLIGRNVSTSMMNLIGDPQRQNVQAKLRIVAVEGDGLVTEFLGFSTLPSAIRRFVRRNREKVNESFCLKTKDGQIIRIKPLCVTRGKTTGSILRSVHKLIRAHVASQVSNLTFEELVQAIVGKKLQQGLHQVLRKLYPMSVCEIRELILIPKDKHKFVEGLVLTPPAPEPKEEPVQEEAQA